MNALHDRIQSAFATISTKHDVFKEHLEYKRRLLSEFDPEKVLARGYSIVRGALQIGQTIEIENSNVIVSAEVKNVSKKQ